MESSRSYKTRLADALQLKELEAINPSWVVAADPAQFTPEYLPKIGIDYAPPVVGKGYIKFQPADFIVEEVTQQGQLIDINPKSLLRHDAVEAKKPRVGAILVKKGMDTFEAVERLAEVLRLPVDGIGYGGLKDSQAITAQEISLNMFSTEGLTDLKIPNLFLKDIHLRSGVMVPGSLRGNHFVIQVRSQGLSMNEVIARAEQVAHQGFLNFYSLQRFGPRLNGHICGRFIMQQQYEAAIREILIGESKHEMFVLQDVRREAAVHWGDWQAMEEMYQHLPSFFFHELNLLKSLKAHSQAFELALQSIGDQTKMLVYAYMSYCFNKLLSHLAETELPEQLPLLRPDPASQELYKAIISEEELASLRFQHRNLPFLLLQRPQLVSARGKVALDAVKESNSGHVFSFELGKGSYATTFLSEIYHLYQGKPAPDWVSSTPGDSLQLLGRPAVAETEEALPQSTDAPPSFESA